MAPNAFAEQIFEVLSFSIDQACRELDWSNVSRDALAFGFTQTDVSTSFSYAQRFDLAIAPNLSLCLHYRSFAPSGPFNTLPAISRFEVILAEGNDVVKSYQNGFDEPSRGGDQTIWHELSFA